MAQEKPTISAVRAPKMMRDRRSRPNWSVPSQCTQLGASVIAAKSLDVGLYGAINSAEKPVTAMISTISMPTAPSGSRWQKCSEACQNERPISISSSVMTGGTVRLCTVVDMMWSPSGEPDARIEPPVQQVDNKVRQHEDR